jgi:UDP-N-acetylmuramoyl-tripeptide--D-alanyl-D-alanine ligase
MKTNDLYELFLNGATICTDSRTLKAGELFFALRGEQYNGNRFAEDALKAGAAAVVCDDPQLAPASHPDCFLTGDSLMTLQALAIRYRSELSVPILAITGSNGKTTTKELIDRVLKTTFQVFATHGNLNNHIGVPLSILSIPRNSEIAVIEMGANHSGEIARLCEIARPDYGLITNIGKAHLEGFGGYAGVIRAKTELYTFLRENGGRVFVNAADPLLMRLSEGMHRILYGNDQTPSASVIAEQALLKLRWEKAPDPGTETATQMSGDYNLANVLAAAAAGLQFKVPWAKIVQAISSYQPANHRSQVIHTQSNTLLMDAYNANPSSMLLALENFSRWEGKEKWAILGDMLELGEESEAEHQAIVHYLAEAGFPNLVFIGPWFQGCAGKGSQAFADTESCIQWLKDHPISNADVLLKGSRGIGLEKLLPYL